jgi:hypothetical protein
LSFLNAAAHRIMNSKIGVGGAGQETTLPSMIAAVRGPLACGGVFPDGASLTSVWLAEDDKFSLEKDGRHLSARS